MAQPPLLPLLSSPLTDLDTSSDGSDSPASLYAVKTQYHVPSGTVIVTVSVPDGISATSLPGP